MGFVIRAVVFVYQFVAFKDGTYLAWGVGIVLSAVVVLCATFLPLGGLFSGVLTFYGAYKVWAGAGGRRRHWPRRASPCPSSCC